MKTKKIVFCKSCVVSNLRPRIYIDKSGICNACLNIKNRLNADWKEKKKKFIKLLQKYKKKNGEYDCIVPSSGGKDSAIVAHKLKYEFGMNPLTVTWSPLRYTDIGFENLVKFSEAGFPIIFGKANGNVLKKLTRKALIEMGDPFQPFIYGQVNFPLQIASKFKIRLIVDGENGEEEYGGDKKVKKKGFNARDSIKYWFSNYDTNYWLKNGFNKKEMNIFSSPPIKEINKLKIERISSSYYFIWSPQNHFYYSARNTNFKTNYLRSEGTYSKYASIDDKFDGFHFYFMFLKFGIGRATSDACQEIRNKQINRQEGVQLVRKYDGEFPHKYYDEFLEFCGLSEKEFIKICDKWRSPVAWIKKNDIWKRRAIVS